MARGPRVTVHECPPAKPEPSPPSPSEAAPAIIGDTVLTFGSNRKIKVREPDVLAEFDLVEALGDLASNETYMRMVMPMLYLSEIDGEPIFQAQNSLQVKAMISRLGKPGMAALTSWYYSTILAPVIAQMKDADAEAKQRERLKK